jgi:spectinomycin phosphotransferase
VETEPPDLDRVELGALVERHWSVRAGSLEYLPVGFGSHHWRGADDSGARSFVTVDRIEANPRLGADPDAALDALDRAFRTAATLRDEAGLEFVVGPLADAAGSVVRRLGERYAVAVFPFVKGRSSGFGAWRSPEERRELARLLGRLHAGTGRIPVELPRREDFAVAGRDALLDALADLDRPWTTGPFAEPARRLLRDGAARLAQRLRRYDELVDAVRPGSTGWVVTHGEPHPANVVRVQGGEPLLVDWDTVRLGPPERDLWMVLDEAASEWPEYLSTAGTATLDERALQLYRLGWDLGDITEYVGLFRRPHERTADTEAACDHLAGYLRVQ